MIAASEEEQKQKELASPSKISRKSIAGGSSSKPADWAVDPIDYTIGKRMEAGSMTSQKQKSEVEAEKLSTAPSLALSVADDSF